MSKHGSSSRTLAVGQLTLFDCQNKRRKSTNNEASNECVDLINGTTSSSICVAAAANSCNATTDSPRESRTVQRESDSCPLALYNERAIETAGSQATEVDADLVTEEFELDFPNETHENNSDTESEAPG